jgi:hypothetical protein
MTATTEVFNCKISENFQAVLVSPDYLYFIMAALLYG